MLAVPVALLGLYINAGSIYTYETAGSLHIYVDGLQEFLHFPEFPASIPTNSNLGDRQSSLTTRVSASAASSKADCIHIPQLISLMSGCLPEHLIWWGTGEATSEADCDPLKASEAGASARSNR